MIMVLRIRNNTNKQKAIAYVNEIFLMTKYNGTPVS